MATRQRLSLYSLKETETSEWRQDTGSLYKVKNNNWNWLATRHRLSLLIQKETETSEWRQETGSLYKVKKKLKLTGDKTEALFIKSKRIWN